MTRLRHDTNERTTNRMYTTNGIAQSNTKNNSLTSEAQQYTSDRTYTTRFLTTPHHARKLVNKLRQHGFNSPLLTTTKKTKQFKITYYL